jgi:AraC-like DNA-binding protein
MRYVEYAPSSRLASIVERFWLLEGSASGAADAILPDGRVELIFHYGGPFWRHGVGPDPLRQPSSLLVGQMVAPVILAPEGRAGVAAIRLRPAAARAVLGFSLAEISGRFVDLVQILPSAAALEEELAEAGGDEARISALESWLRDARRGAPRPPVEAAVSAILQSGGRVSIDALTTLAGTSARQLERQFQEDVGLPPKVFARIVRLQAALHRVRSGAPLSEVALSCGYYDQAHMTRDFRQLAAMSPGVWRGYAGELAPLFVNASSPALAPASW